MYGKTRDRRLAHEINVVPYIDVMLVLLVIFMVTAPLLTQGVDVNLPDASAEVMDYDPDNEPLILSVDSKGQLYLNVGKNQDQPRSAEDIERAVKVVLARKPDTPVMVEGDADADYEHVVKGMVLLQKAGARRLGLATEPRQLSGRN